MKNNLPLLLDLSFTDLEAYLISIGEPRYRAKQIWAGIYQQFAEDINQITSLPTALREKLADVFDFSAFKPIQTIQSNDGLTTKVLFELRDGALIEAVLMLYESRRTICISSQSGCSLGCVFCATGQMGFSSNLSNGEILAQVLYFERLLAQENERVTNIVIMGMGEPFLNYDQVMSAVERINDPEGIGLGARRITISTVGLVPKIKQFADANTQINLAISLHTVDNDLRTQLMPINKKYPVQQVLDACRYYVKKTNRRITFEYALIDDVNDTATEARALASRIKGLLCHVNLIRLNPTRGFNGRSAKNDRVEEFKKILEANQIPCTVRLRRGVEIRAGCGQLAALDKENNQPGK